MTAGTRHETLIKAITDLGEDGGGQSWHERKFEWHAAADAINALSPTRARQLTVSMVAVLLDLSEKQTTRVLRKPPDAGSFHATHNRPSDYDRIMAPVPAYAGKVVKRARWVYHRERVKAWWAVRLGEQEATKERQDRQRRLKELTKQRSDLADLMQRHAQELARMDADLEQLRMLNVFAANSTYEAATSAPQPWIVDEHGQLLDHAWLPVSSVEAITEVLETVGDIRWMPLSEALGGRQWRDDAVRDAWVSVWNGVAERAHARIDEVRSRIRAQWLMQRAAGHSSGASRDRSRS